MNVERLIGNCPKCKLSHCLFDKCDRYKSLYPRLESVDLTPYIKLVRICEREASKLRKLSRPLSLDEVNFLRDCDSYSLGRLGIIQLRASALKFFKSFSFSKK